MYIIDLPIRKRNAEKLKPHFHEKDQLDGIFSDMANEYLQQVTIKLNYTFVACLIMTPQ